MCEIQKNPKEREKITNMYLVKVHGGTSSKEIIDHANNAQKLAKKNSQKYPGMFAILFFDEANSTESIGMIKEAICGNRIDGKYLEKDTGLKIIAA
jgi:E3 ubiquitin-protein ligase RNF213